MKRSSVLTHAVTDPYSDLEARLYDTLFAPAVLAMVRAEIDAWCAGLPVGARVLDVGCGGGQTALAMLELRNDLEIVGIDLSSAQVERARRRAAGRPQARFEVASALDLPFAPSSFDAALSVAAIKHWPSPLAGMKECVRVLRPGSSVLLVEVDRGCRLGAVRSLLAHSRVPRLLQGVALPLLRTFIIGQGLDLDDFRELLASLPLADASVRRLEDMPAVALRGRVKFDLRLSYC